MKASRYLPLVFGMLALVVGTPPARAEPPDYKKMRFVERGKNLAVYASFTELFDKEAYEALSSGFPTTVVTKLYLYRKKQELPVVVHVLSTRVVYDLWDEIYLLRVDSPGGRQNLRIRSRIDVLERLTSFKNYPIANLASIEIGPHYFVALEVELNPVDEERLAEMRRWLTKPTSETRLDSSSSFFGSFVSVFVNPKMQKADRILRLRSQPFYRKKR